MTTKLFSRQLLLAWGDPFATQRRVEPEACRENGPTYRSLIRPSTIFREFPFYRAAPCAVNRSLVNPLCPRNFTNFEPRYFQPNLSRRLRSTIILYALLFRTHNFYRYFLCKVYAGTGVLTPRSHCTYFN